MYAYLKGNYIEYDEDNLVIEVGSVGYNVKMVVSDISALPARGSELKVYTYTSVREDAIWLYGFLTKDELKMFRLLITVNGIGPKAAQGILSVMTPSDLRFAIFSGDVKSISKAPGVGPKGAQRIILDLKDKVSIEDNLGLGIEEDDSLASGSQMVGKQAEAVEALTALGYSRGDATRAIASVVYNDSMSVEDILKQSLKSLAFM